MFTIRFRDRQGEAIHLSALEAEQFQIGALPGVGDGIILSYQSIGGQDVNVQVEIRYSSNDPLSYWYLSIENETDYIIEWIDFPDVVVPNDLVGTGGQSRIVWPALEGALIEDVTIREKGWYSYKEPGYPSETPNGMYPGPCPTQFMAYYNERGGLYFGAHDEHANVKSIEYYRFDDGIRLQYRLFAEGFGRGVYRMEYPMVFGVFEGDWYAAADIYRSWYDASNARMGPKLWENKKLPEWFEESPIIVGYPVRGTVDVGNMDPNEYYPYVNAIPCLQNLSQGFNSKVMALLMHWEGTAPWAPPYVWPPFGGEAPFRDFVEQMHEQGNLVGVYGSGIGWTNESLVIPEYNKTSELEEKGLKSVMCASPAGEVSLSKICAGSQRWGYDMCPTNEFVTQVVMREIRSILDSGCDYIQYFDQNHGGLSYFCYSKKHGHPPGPGKCSTICEGS